MKTSKKKEGNKHTNETNIAAVWFDYQAASLSPSPYHQTEKNLPTIQY